MNPTKILSHIAMKTTNNAEDQYIYTCEYFNSQYLITYEIDLAFFCFSKTKSIVDVQQLDQMLIFRLLIGATEKRLPYCLEIVRIECRQAKSEIATL